MNNAVTILLGALLFAQNSAAPPPPPMVVDKVSDDFYVVRGEGGNTSVYLTDESLIIVDPKFERNHDELVENRCRAVAWRTAAFARPADDDHSRRQEQAGGI
jgi:hypothetical protein